MQEENMKFRFIKLGAIFMTAMTAVMGAGTIRAQAASIRAGVSVALAECLHENVKVAATQKDGAKAQEQAVQQEAVPAQEKAANKAKKRSKKSVNAQENTICGYTNLGIANVSNYLNVRAEAGEDAKIVGKLPADAGCEILDTKDGWYYIRSGKVSGYVRADYIIT